MAIFTFLGVTALLSGHVTLAAILALGPAGLIAFGLGYLVDLAIFTLLVRRTMRAYKHPPRTSA